MNNPTRKTIAKLLEQLADIRDTVDELQSEEQDKYDNLSEGIQASERGEAIQEAADNLESAVSSLEEAIDYLTEAQA